MMKILFVATILCVTILEMIDGLPTDVLDRRVAKLDTKIADWLKRYEKSNLYKLIARNDAGGPAPDCCSRPPFACYCCMQLCQRA